jgi:hypothetical protein
MNIIELAKRVGYPIQHPEWQKATEEFSALVEAAARAEEREACAKVCEDSVEYAGSELARQIRARGQTPCNHEWIDATTTKPQWHCAKCGVEYTKEQP